MRKRALVTMSCLPVVAAAVAQNISLKAPKLLPWSQQMAVREHWLEKRHQMILPMMRRFDIDMWIVVNEEFHDDPLTQYIAPARPYAGVATCSYSWIQARKACEKLPLRDSPNRICSTSSSRRTNLGPPTKCSPKL